MVGHQKRRRRVLENARVTSDTVGVAPLAGSGMHGSWHKQTVRRHVTRVAVAFLGGFDQGFNVSGNTAHNAS